MITNVWLNMKIITITINIKQSLESMRVLGQKLEV